MHCVHHKVHGLAIIRGAFLVTRHSFSSFSTHFIILHPRNFKLSFPHFIIPLIRIFSCTSDHIKQVSKHQGEQRHKPQIPRIRRQFEVRRGNALRVSRAPPIFHTHGPQEVFYWPTTVRPAHLFQFKVMGKRSTRPRAAGNSIMVIWTATTTPVPTLHMDCPSTSSSRVSTGVIISTTF